MNQTLENYFPLLIGWLAFCVCQCTFALGLIVAAVSFRIPMRKISIGGNCPIVWQKKFGDVNVTFGPVPSSGIDFVNREDLQGAIGNRREYTPPVGNGSELSKQLALPDQHLFEELHPLRRVVVGTMGVLFQFVFGVLLLGIPVIVGGRAIEHCDPDLSSFKRIGTPAFRLLDNPATVVSQKNFVIDSFRTFVNCVTRRDPTNKVTRGLFASFFTAGQLMRVDGWAFVSFLGLTMIWAVVLNLVPLPGTIGFNALAEVVGMVTGFKTYPLSPMLSSLAVYCWLLLIGYIVMIDLHWLLFS